MLAKRIIPCLDVHNGRVVKGINFVNLRDAGDPVEQAKVYDAEGADELIFLDITATHEGRSTMLKVARAVADQVFIPFTVGGGIRTVEDMREMLRAGADKVGINSAALKNPQVLTDGAKEFGAQAIVCAMDARLITASRRQGQSDTGYEVATPAWIADMPELAISAESKWEVYVRGGRVPTGVDAVKWAIEAERRGAGEILLTSMDGDGTQEGYDIALTRAISTSVTIPVIASGGAGKLHHFAQALTEGSADAALAASLFHFRDMSVGEVKAYLAEQNIPVRVTS
ncbi:MAG: imidazole glycerol phosphate synthase subunit HisF [Candidatus Promineifilaceae bacterium]